MMIYRLLILFLLLIPTSCGNLCHNEGSHHYTAYQESELNNYGAAADIFHNCCWSVITDADTAPILRTVSRPKTTHRGYDKRRPYSGMLQTVTHEERCSNTIYFLRQQLSRTTFWGKSLLHLLCKLTI